MKEEKQKANKRDMGKQLCASTYAKALCVVHETSAAPKSSVSPVRYHSQMPKVSSRKCTVSARKCMYLIMLNLAADFFPG